MNAPLTSRLGRLVSRFRRPLAAVFAAAAVGTAIIAVRAPAPVGVPILTAAHDLPGGTALRPGDITVRSLPGTAVPDGALRAPATRLSGRLIAGPMRRGEPITDARLLSTGLLGGPGAVATPVRVADAATARLLRPGDRVDVLAAATTEVAEAAEAADARVVASTVSVVTVPRTSVEYGTDEGALVVLATTREQATTLAAMAVNSRLSITIVSGANPLSSQ